MPIKPRYKLSDSVAPSRRKFTDREEFLDTFKEALAQKDSKTHKIIVYYGVGGVGKTTLRRELCRIIDSEHPCVLWSVLDFDNPSQRDEETALFWLRKSFNNKYSIDFPSFEIAYGFLWQKTRPQIPLNKDNCSLIDEGGLLSDILDVAGDMPGIDIISAGVRAVVQGQKHIREWWKRRGKREAKRLADMEPQDILKRLPMYWAADFKENLDRAEVETLKVLSIPRFFNFDIFENLIGHFKTGYPLTAFRELLRFSFIDKDKDEHSWVMHELMRKNLLKALPEELLKRVNLRLFEFYSKMLEGIKAEEVTERHRTAMIEAFHHGEAALHPEEFAEWCLVIGKTMNHPSLWSFIAPIYEEMADLFREKLGVAHPAVARSFELLAITLQNLGEYKKAENVAKGVLKEIEASLGENHVYFRRFLNGLGTIYLDRAKYAEAGECFQRALGLEKNAKEANHTRIALCTGNLAIAYDYQGKYYDAEKLYRESLDIIEKSMNPGSVLAGNTMGNLASVCSILGKYAEAEEFGARSLGIKKKVFGTDSLEYASGLNEHSCLFLTNGKYDEKEILGDKHPDVARMNFTLGEVYKNRKVEEK
ncbi:ATP-binding protein [bacterium]|nr:ATP-binding protein [bacterium]